MAGSSRTSSIPSFADEFLLESFASALDDQDQLLYHSIDRNETTADTQTYLSDRLHGFLHSPVRRPTLPASMFMDSSPYAPHRKPEMYGGVNPPAPAHPRTDMKGAIFKPVPHDPFAPMLVEDPSSGHDPSADQPGPSRYTGLSSGPYAAAAPQEEPSSSSSTDSEDEEGDVVMGGTESRQGGSRGTPARRSPRTTRISPSTRGRGRGRASGGVRGASPRARRRGGR